MKDKYLSQDSRTGHVEGSIVELTLEELNKLPFNVFMKKVDEKKDEKIIDSVNIEQDKVELRIDLLNKGLSTQRTEKIVDKYGSLEELKKNVSKAGIDEIIDEWLKKAFKVKSKAKAAKQKTKEEVK